MMAAAENQSHHSQNVTLDGFEIFITRLCTGYAMRSAIASL